MVVCWWVTVKILGVVLVSLAIMVGWPSGSASLVPAGPLINGGFELVVNDGGLVCQVGGDNEVEIPPGTPLIVVNPCNTSATKALAWSSPRTTVFGNFHAAEPDREVKIPANASHGSHNLWQSWANPQQLFTANFSLFEFKVEAGTVPSAANVQVGLSLSPGYAQHPFVGVFWEGAVYFNGSDVQPDTLSFVRMDPARDGSILCPADYSPCLDFQADFDAANLVGKRELLGQARMVQVSFWNFNTGSSDVVLDWLLISGAKTVPEES